MVISGIVENIIFRNDENGYTVLEFIADDSLVTVVGNFPIICEGEALTLVGEYRTASKFGEQFEATEVSFDAPTDENGIAAYLASGLFKGVGDALARAIVKKFGVRTLDIIENAPERLREVNKVGPATARAVAKSYREHIDMQRTLIFLQKLGVPLGVALKIYKTYGDKAPEIIADNPYRLAEDVDGIGFLTADRIAVGVGIESDSEFRISAGIIHILGEAAGKSGHTALPIEQLIKNADALLGEPGEDAIRAIIPHMIMNSKLRSFVVGEGDSACEYISSNQNYSAENAIAAKLLKLYYGANVIEIDVEREIRQYEERNDLFLHSVQKTAIETAVNSGIMVITGGPGTGKTTIIKGIAEILTDKQMRVALTAPTGRAAKRMSEAAGIDAATVHRLLGMEFSSGKPNFKYNEINPLPADVVILDEASMADIYIFNALLKALEPGTRLILVGDKDQLPSVSAGNILSDVISGGIFPVISLTEIYRQKGDSLIITNAHLINRGEMPVINNRSEDFFVDNKSSTEDILETVLSLITERIPNYFNLKSSDIQVLAPMKKGISGVENLNNAIRNVLNPIGSETRVNGVLFRAGDKVMQSANDYDLKWEKYGGGYEEGSGVFNGDVGHIKRIGLNGDITVEFEDGKVCVYEKEKRAELILAYAVSIHKSQGSEFPAVIIALSGGAYMIMNRNLLYTAVTRAKKLVVIVGSYDNIRKMVENDYTAKRYTLLKELLWVNQKKLNLLRKD